MNRLSTEVGRADSVAANAQKQLDEAIQRVPEAFQAYLCEDASDASGLAEELRSLEATDAEREFASIANDRTLQAERERQLAEYQQKIATVPDDARLPVAQAQAAVTAAGKALQAADDTKSAAIGQLTTLTGQRTERENIANRLAIEERNHTLHQRLADLLGDKGIQLDLVRVAERRIVEFANDVLGRVSCGDLRIDPPDPAGDRAFDLTVRRLGCAGPIAAANLSGGQRFRLAVSLALAVCRFANGESRPLESVIVDEGFGSLDRDGRMAMIAELRDGQTLRQLFKRVLIVSHQDDFASAFPVGYWLRSEDGVTVAEPFGPR